jgi:ABC-type transport system involved in cytochrome bd biosynthesis fused ATPase/permease subunit
MERDKVVVRGGFTWLHTFVLKHFVFYWHNFLSLPPTIKNAVTFVLSHLSTQSFFLSATQTQKQSQSESYKFKSREIVLAIRLLVIGRQDTSCHNLVSVEMDWPTCSRQQHRLRMVFTTTSTSTTSQSFFIFYIYGFCYHRKWCGQNFFNDIFFLRNKNKLFPSN